MPTVGEEEAEPCIACGAPVIRRGGHDEGCALETEDDKMARAMRYDPDTFRDEDGPWGGGFARNH